MNDYREVRLDITPCSEDTTDIMAALLADAGYESFVPDEKGLTAYVREADFTEEALQTAIGDCPFDCAISASHRLIAGRDWNAEWEKNYFKPIVVGDRVAIHSSFHTEVPEAEHHIVIDPKMAFGTGHHATTSQVIKALLTLDLRQKDVIDMGTGTAILAILSAMLGARKVTGIEIDEFAWRNAVENAALNGHSEIALVHGDASALASAGQADVFIANINRNIITADIEAYARALRPGGIMLLSGFYVEDIPVIMAAAQPHSLREEGYTDLERWVCLRLIKDQQQ